MAIVAVTTPITVTVLDEIRIQLDSSLTDAEVPDDVIDNRFVLRGANRWVLTHVGMTVAEYNALASDDVRREIFEEAVIGRCASELVPVVAQLVVVNANGLLTRYQQINWIMRRKQLDLHVLGLLSEYRSGSGFYEAVTRDKKGFV